MTQLLFPDGCKLFCVVLRVILAILLTLFEVVDPLNDDSEIRRESFCVCENLVADGSFS